MGIITQAPSIPPAVRFSSFPREETIARLPAPRSILGRHLRGSTKEKRSREPLDRYLLVAGPMGLEPTASGVTGRRYNRLNYDPAVALEQCPAARRRSLEICPPAVNNFFCEKPLFYAMRTIRGKNIARIRTTSRCAAMTSRISL
ncbi:MAG: hypothetical protein JG774_1249 [Desulfomicrobiaceae bacterium]|nr:hypothetical protein [Desulfomicrobiaceae bacterium]MDI3492776.1 hypothetical protein [Desulfomicrobiaceae bacterium]MDK2873853.1 hypothetical protein [Desulfomicrobiaceae bacterium]